MNETHAVTNQAPPLAGYDVYGADRALIEAVEREGGGWAADELHALGRTAGSPEAVEWGFAANENRPVLHTHDRYGHRLDTVAYHPAYHELMRVSVGQGLHSAPWFDTRPGAHVARAAKFFVWSQVDAGHTCPISMTYAVVPALAHQPDLLDQWRRPLSSDTYDARFAPADAKTGALFGMAMTEKQGGSDVRANTTTAAAAEGAYRLVGHKWFCSAPMSDAFLALAQAPGGLTCFLVPRWQPDGTVNAIAIQRLKDKLGDRSNASSEVEYRSAFACRVGDEGAGVRTIIEMVNHTRLDCVIGSAANMRAALTQALHHTHHRHAFGRVLVDQPLMRAVLCDLALESEAATAAAMRLARAHDGMHASAHDIALRRLTMPAVKYYVCKRAPAVAAEALECLGGNGYVEESIMPRLFRQSPLNGIWEGSGNVIALDVLRALARAPESVDALADELDRARGADHRFDEHRDALLARLRHPITEATARLVAEQIALAFQAAVLLTGAPSAVADAFCATRLAGERGATFGTIHADAAPIVARAWG